MMFIEREDMMSDHVWLITWRPVLVTARIAGQRSMVAMLAMC
jgi:hypothetical protein